jgi:hypothetical protein
LTKIISRKILLSFSYSYIFHLWQYINWCEKINLPFKSTFTQVKRQYFSFKLFKFMSGRYWNTVFTIVVWCSNTPDIDSLYFVCLIPEFKIRKSL